MTDAKSTQPDANAKPAAKPAKRRRGRPPASERAENGVKEQLIVAAREVYGDFGYNGSSVERIIERANVSRPTFYRLFKDRYDIIEIVVEQAHNQLRDHIVKAITDEQVGKGGPLVMAGAAVDAYFAWCEQLGSLVGSLYSEMHDENSPASRHRQRIIKEFVQLLHLEAEKRGRPQLEPVFYDVLIRAVEHAGSTAFSPDPKPEEVIAKHRAAAARVLMAGLAGADDVGDLPGLEALAM